MLKAHSIRNKIMYTILALIIYRIVSFIPVPVINVEKLSAFSDVVNKGIFSVFNTFSGGSIARASILALGIMPYITSSIIIQLIVATTPELKKMKKEGGEKVNEKFNQWTKYLAVVIGFGQGLGLSSILSSAATPTISPLEFKIIAASTMLCGTFCLIWLGNMISMHGIGNGTSLIIFTGIVAEAPKDISRILTLAKNGAITPIELFAIFALFCATVALVVLFEKSNRLVFIQYPRQVQHAMQQQKQNSQNFLPLKINPAGVMPPIFASSIILLPSTIASIFRDSNSTIVNFIIQNFAHGTVLFIFAEIILITFFSFFYNNVVFDPEEVSNQLRKSNIFIPGTRPGQPTADLFKSIMARLSLIGALYLSIICSLPEILSPKYGYSFLIGGTGILIVVNVIQDTVTAIQTQLLPAKYEKAMRKVYK